MKTLKSTDCEGSITVFFIVSGAFVQHNGTSSLGRKVLFCLLPTCLRGRQKCTKCHSARQIYINDLRMAPFLTTQPQIAALQNQVNQRSNRGRQGGQGHKGEGKGGYCAHEPSSGTPAWATWGIPHQRQAHQCRRHSITR